jgi:hypothetical protein
MISVTVVAALCVLAVATQVGVFVFAVITETSDTIVSPDIHASFCENSAAAPN